MTCVVVYGREPIAGRVKTRLAASIGDEAAAELYSVLLARSVQQAVLTGFHAVLAVSNHPGAGWQPPPDAALDLQRGSDLGARLKDTFDRRFSEGWSKVIIVGSDCPGMAAHHIQSAAVRLERYAAVVGPAEDGGYWLIGQRAPGTDLFSGIPWSSHTTMEATRRRLREKGTSWAEIDRLADIDTIDDVLHALASEEFDEGLRSALAKIMDETCGYHGLSGG
jgi:rSAM/selenodomain-associated transferase 1